MSDPVTASNAVADRPPTPPSTTSRRRQAVVAAAASVVLAVAGLIVWAAADAKHSTHAASGPHSAAARIPTTQASASAVPSSSGAATSPAAHRPRPPAGPRPVVAARFADPLRVADVLYAARAGVTGLLSYDYRTPAGLAAHSAAYATPAARSRFAGQLGPAAIRNRVVARTTVLAAGITSLRGPDATALAFVDRRVSRRGVTRVLRSHLAVRLREQGGRWLVDAVQDGGDPTPSGLPASAGLAAACTTARHVVLAFVTWTPGTAYAHAVALRRLASLPFRDQLARAARPQLLAAAQRGERLTGTIRSLAVALTTGDSAVVLVGGEQVAHRRGRALAHPFRYQLTIVRVGLAWYVSDLQVLT